MGGVLVGDVSSVDAARDRSGAGGCRAQRRARQEHRDAARRQPFHDPREGCDRREVPVHHARALTPTWRQGATFRSHRPGRRRPRPGAVDVHAADPKGGHGINTGFAEALTGRGAAINDAIGAFRRWSTISSVMRNLSSPARSWAASCAAWERSPGPGPVAQQQASLFQNLDGTFRSLASWPAVPTAVDPQTPPNVRDGDQGQSPGAGVPSDAPACLPICAQEWRRCGPALRCSPPRSPRDSQSPAQRCTGPAGRQPVGQPGGLRRQLRGHPGTGATDPDRGPAHPAAELPDARPEHLQLRIPAPAQPGLDAV